MRCLLTVLHRVATFPEQMAITMDICTPEQGSSVLLMVAVSPRLTALCLLCAGVFLGLGLSGVVPTMHFTIAEGFVKATTVGQMGWFFLMAVMYITGAGLYAARIPERFFPGKFDIWVRSTLAAAPSGKPESKAVRVTGPCAVWGAGMNLGAVTDRNILLYF